MAIQVKITRTAIVSIEADNDNLALAYAKEIHESGDANGALGEAVYEIERIPRTDQDELMDALKVWEGPYPINASNIELFIDKTLQVEVTEQVRYNGIDIDYLCEDSWLPDDWQQEACELICDNAHGEMAHNLNEALIVALVGPNPDSIVRQAFIDGKIVLTNLLLNDEDIRVVFEKWDEFMADPSIVVFAYDVEEGFDS